jgi:hypothetical protein
MLLMEWFWRISQARPDADLMIRWALAAEMVVWEHLPTNRDRLPSPRVIEYLLARADLQTRVNEHLHPEDVFWEFRLSFAGALKQFGLDADTPHRSTS